MLGLEGICSIHRSPLKCRFKRLLQYCHWKVGCHGQALREQLQRLQQRQVGNDGGTQDTFLTSEAKLRRRVCERNGDRAARLRCHP